MFKKGDKVKIIGDGWHQTFLKGIPGYFDSHIDNRNLVGREAIIIRKKESEENWQETELQNTQGAWGWLVRVNNEYTFLVMEHDLELIKRENKPMKLNTMMRRLLNADIKKLIKADLMNGDLLLTEEGKNALYALLVETYKKELVEIAKEIIQEKEEDK